MPDKPHFQVSSKNSIFADRSLRKSFQNACKRAGIRDFHFYDLRHTFTSQLVMAGVDITTVSKLLGHMNLKMTLRYSHLAPGHLDRAVSKMYDLLAVNRQAIKAHEI